VAAPPAPESWFLEASRCWCGGREHGSSPCSAEYFVCERCGTHVSRRRLRPDRVADFYSLSGYWHARQREKAHPTLLERRALLERDGRVDRWVTAIERHALGNKGVAVALNNVQKLGDGPRLDSRMAAEDEFEATAAEPSALD
jgi:hypothetical protein